MVGGASVPRAGGVESGRDLACDHEEAIGTVPFGEQSPKKAGEWHLTHPDPRRILWYYVILV